MGSRVAMPNNVPPKNGPIALKAKSDIHLLRKIWHCVGICMMAAIYNYFTTRTVWIFLLIAIAIILPLDYLRSTRPGLNRATHRLFGSLMRKHEAHALSGMSYLYLGCAVLMLLNEKHIVTLTLLFLAFGDPVASFFGIRFGKDRILGNKTLQGTMAGFGVCTLVAAFYYYFNNIMVERLLIVAPLSGLIGALAELVPVGKLDDNFTIPVVSAALLWILFKVYGGFGL